MRISPKRRGVIPGMTPHGCGRPPMLSQQHPRTVIPPRPATAAHWRAPPKPPRRPASVRTTVPSTSRPQTVPADHPGRGKPLAASRHAAPERPESVLTTEQSQTHPRQAWGVTMAPNSRPSNVTEVARTLRPVLRETPLTSAPPPWAKAPEKKKKRDQSRNRKDSESEYEGDAKRPEAPHEIQRHIGESRPPRPRRARRPPARGLSAPRRRFPTTPPSWGGVPGARRGLAGPPGQTPARRRPRAQSSSRSCSARSGSRSSRGRRGSRRWCRRSGR